MRLQQSRFLRNLVTRRVAPAPRVARQESQDDEPVLPVAAPVVTPVPVKAMPVHPNVTLAHGEPKGKAKSEAKAVVLRAAKPKAAAPKAKPGPPKAVAPKAPGPSLGVAQRRLPSSVMPKAPKASVAKARASGDSAARGPGRLGEESPDEYFDRLARVSYNPGQYPTVIHSYQPDSLSPGVILGPMPTANLQEFFNDFSVRMVVTCFDGRVEDKGGWLPHNSMVYLMPIARFNQKSVMIKSSWMAIRKSLRATVAAGESVYIHCAAGLHRGPFPAAMIAGLLAGRSLDEQINFIQQFRPIEPWKFASQRGVAAALAWMRDETDRRCLPPITIQWPLKLCRSSAASGAWHALSAAMAGQEHRQPACRWRQSGQNMKAFFSGETMTADSVEEALALRGRWCRHCFEVFPSGAQATLVNSHVEYTR